MLAEFIYSLNKWLAVHSRKTIYSYFVKQFQMYAVTDTSLIDHNRYLVSVLEFILQLLYFQ